MNPAPTASTRPAEVAVAVTLRPDPSGDLLLDVDSRHPGAKRFRPVLVSRDSVQDARRDLGPFLNEVKNEIGSELEPPAAGLEKAMRLLDARSDTLLAQLMGDHGPQMQGLIDDLTSVFAQRPDWLNPAVIEVESPTDVQFPFELLSLIGGGAAKWPPRIRDPFELVTACSSFLGFRAIIRRIVRRAANDDDESTSPEQLPQNRRLEAPPPVTFFRHVELRGTGDEINYFRSLGSAVEFRGPWPADDAEMSREQIMELLYRCAPEERQPKDVIEHFACHAEPDPGAGDQAMFIVRGKTDQPEVFVSIADLRAAFTSRFRQGRARDCEFLPLVFMNACGSAEFYPHQASSFPRFFVNQGYRGFIGTETSMPDQLAAQLSQVFYSRLFEGCPAARALHLAKWAMVTRFGNPLGILYTLYADQDLALDIKGGETS